MQEDIQAGLDAFLRALARAIVYTDGEVPQSREWLIFWLDQTGREEGRKLQEAAFSVYDDIHCRFLNQSWDTG